jgi:hypothetical protein
VVEREAEKLRGYRVSLDLIQGRQGGDKEVEVDLGVILHSKVVDDENKTDRASKVTEQTGSGSFDEAKGRQERDKTTVTQLTGFLKTVHGLVDPEEAVPLAGRVDLDEGEERETGQDFRRVRVDIDFNKLRREERSAKIEIDKVKRTKDSIFGDNGIEDTVEGSERSGVGGGRAGGRETVTTRSSAHATQDVVGERAERTWGEEGEGGPLLPDDPIVVGRRVGARVDGAKGAGGGDQLDEFRAVTEGPLGPKGAGQGGPKSEGLTRAVEVEDRGEGGKSNRESKRRAKEGRGASR